MNRNSFIRIVLLVVVLLSASRGGFAEEVTPTHAPKTLQPAASRPAAAPLVLSTPPSPAAPAAAPPLQKQSEGAGLGKIPETSKIPEPAVATPETLSAIEKIAVEEAVPGEAAHPQPYHMKELVQFGYNFFRPSEGGFAPLTDIPVGPDYVIGPGDRIILNLWGSVESTLELEVNRSGEIVLPRVGSVKVWGVSFGQLRDVLKASLSRNFRDLNLNVTMGKLRLIKVFVVGEVKSPGDYNLSPLSTLINALSAAGGPLKTGTLRNIQIMRGKRVVETVDLYDFFLKGDKSKDIRLQPGDTIFVPVIGKVAGIGGNVKRPALYELKDEKTLGDLITLAEGLLPTGYLQRVQISRVDAHEKKAVADFNLEPKSGTNSLDQTLSKIKIQDMDIVKIFPIDATLRDHVRLDGYVLRPGDYALKPGMRLSQLLLQDNLLPEYYKNAAEITRLAPPDYHPEKIFVNVAMALAGDPTQDLELKEFDQVRIFSRWEMEEMPTVKISGEVQRPGEYRLFPKMTVRDLLLEAGNPKSTAYLPNAEISRLNQTGGEVSSFPIEINLDEAIKGNPKDNLVLVPRDELSVRKIPNWTETKERYVTVQGEFRFPGVYPIYKGEKMSSVIARAGGFTGKAYLPAAKFTRASVREQQQQRMDELTAKTEQEILKKQSEVAQAASTKEELDSTKAALDNLQRVVTLLKSAKAEGRLTIRLTAPDRFKDSEYDVELEGGDLLDVPRKPNAVNVVGQVYNPTSFIPVANQDVAYYLDEAGGPTNDADEGDIYIVRTNGTVVSRHQVSLFKTMFLHGFMSTTVEPGDTVIVPQKYEKTAWMRGLKDIAVILGNLALAAGVMVAAGL